MTRRHLAHDSPWLLPLLAALVALGPLSVDMYLPAMPRMQDAFGTDISHMHLTLSAYLAGFALFHLVCGPLADRFGRRPIMLGGTALFTVASVGCAMSATVEQLLLCRFVQGIGACVGPTLARAVARDVFGPTRAARALSLIAMLMALAPAVAPTVGGVLLLWLPWPVVFVFLAVYGLATLALIQLFLAESLPQRQSLHPLAIARNFSTLLRNRGFMTATLGSSLIYAGLLIYLSSSSFVYIQMLGVPVQWFGLIFLSTVVGYIAGSALSARLSLRRVLEDTVLTGAALATGASCAMLLGGLLLPDSVLALMLPMTLYSAGMGLVLPNAMAIALRPFPHIAGTASALLGFIQMALSALASAAVGRLLTTSPMPMLWGMAGITVIALMLCLRLRRPGSPSESPASEGPPN